MAIYINSAEAITAQNTFNTNMFLGEPEKIKKDFFTCLHPDYTQFINPKILRRMSNIIKMGISTSLKALDIAKTQMPDAIIIGTGIGCIYDTTKFLKQLIENEEDLLNPTAFIQSTHNSIAGQLALILGCKNYNFTYTQKDISFETALIDAFLMLHDNNAENILLGGGDEITEESYNYMNKVGCTKVPVDNIYKSKTKGVIPGEGFCSFILSNKRSNKNIACIKGISCFNTIKDKEIPNDLKSLFKDNNIDVSDIDVLISGDNGDFSLNKEYNSVREILKNSMHTVYKHLSGEYDTVSAFATWIAVNIIEKQEVPKTLRFNKIHKKIINKVLIHSYSIEHKHSFILISKH